MILTFTWPSTVDRAGGVTALYEFANGLARRGHEVHFVHGPAWPGLVTSIDQLGWFPFEASITHHIVEELTPASLPPADVQFHPGIGGPGLPCAVVQGFRMVPLELEREVYVAPGPKVCVSRWLVDLGRRFGVPAARLWHVPMGLDHERFAVRVPDDLRPYDVAMWENPHPSKGSRVGWEALALAHEARPHLRAVVFSHADPSPAIAARAASMPWVDLRVGLDQEGLAREVYDQARSFLQPSYVEGFGFTAVEAMACGAALVSTANGGSLDYAVDDVTALVRRPGDAAGLAGAIVELVDDHERRARLAAAGSELVRRFVWSAGAEVLEGHLLRYVADPDAFQGPLELDTDPDFDPSVDYLAALGA